MLKYRPAFSTHLPVLIKVLEISEGPVLELGAGAFSTPILHWLCFENNRKLVTYENDPGFFRMNQSFLSDLHEVKLAEDWDKIPIETEHWGVAFVDHGPAERRRIEIERLSNIADYIVVHDTEPEFDAEYGFAREIFPKFKYCYNYEKTKPHTTVLSNFISFHL